MSNTLITPEQVAATALAILSGDLVLARTVNREAQADFGGKSGATVHVRVPASLAANTRALDATTAVTLSDLTERDQPVTLDEMAYSAVRLSDEDLTLRIEDFAAQILAPQVTAVARHVEQRLADLMGGLTEDATIAYDSASPRKALLAARKVLRDMGVPAGEMYAVVGTSIAADLLDDPVLANVSASGDESALRDATIGKVAGFTVIESNLVTATDIVCYHRDAFTLATVAPAVPDGVAFGQSVAEGGYALRHIRDYDSTTMGDRSIVSTFVGARSNTLTKTDGTTAIPAVRIDTTTP